MPQEIETQLATHSRWAVFMWVVMLQWAAIALLSIWIWRVDLQHPPTELIHRLGVIEGRLGIDSQDSD